MTQRYVVLDLDHTLICSKSHDFTHAYLEHNRAFYIQPIAIQTLFCVYRRKHITHFLDELEKRGYKIIVWSAGSDTYVKDIVSVLFLGRQLEYVLTANHLDDREYKDLRIVEKYVPGFLADNARLVDDSPAHSTGQDHRCIIIQKFDFRGREPRDSEDDELLLTLADRVDSSFS